MEKVLQLALNNPEKAITLLLLIVSTSLFLTLKKVLIKKLDDFSDKMTYWEKSIRTHMSGTKLALVDHSTNMGNATKAINGDMLHIRENIFELKSSLLDEIEKLKSFAGEIERNLLKTTEKSEANIQALHRIKEETKVLHSKIIMIDDENHKTTVRVVKLDEQMGQTAKALKNHKDRIENLYRQAETIKKG